MRDAKAKFIKSEGKRATSYDVARVAGVSQSAVSRCFKPGASVSAKTRAKVENAAKVLGYTVKCHCPWLNLWSIKHCWRIDYSAYQSELSADSV